MSTVTVTSVTGAKAGTAELADDLFGIQPNVPVMHQVVTAQLAARRAGSASTKTRSEVRGGGAKPYRQKGTGNARQGSIRQPVRKGGGHAKQKWPKDWRQAMPKKARRLATQSALLLKFQANDVRVVDNLVADAPKTKVVAQMYKKLGIDRSCLLALSERNENVEKSARNIDRTKLTTVAKLNAWDILKHRTLLLTRSGLQQLLA